jgi:hypothetical protein
MLAQSITALIRTAVPGVVGLFLGWLAARGFNLDPDTQAGLIAAVTAVAIAAYYALVSLLERKVNPAFGWLLGSAKVPTYDATAKVDDSSPTGQSAGPASPLPDGTPVEVAPQILGKA